MHSVFTALLQHYHNNISPCCHPLPVKTLLLAWLPVTCTLEPSMGRVGSAHPATTQWAQRCHGSGDHGRDAGTKMLGSTSSPKTVYRVWWCWWWLILSIETVKQITSPGLDPVCTHSPPLLWSAAVCAGPMRKYYSFCLEGIYGGSMKLGC